MTISILFPRTWSREVIECAVDKIADAGYSVEWISGDTDAPCIDAPDCELIHRLMTT